MTGWCLSGSRQAAIRAGDRAQDPVRIVLQMRTFDHQKVELNHGMPVCSLTLIQFDYV